MTSTIAIATLMLRALLGPVFQMFPFPGPGMHQAATGGAITWVNGGTCATGGSGCYVPLATISGNLVCSALNSTSSPTTLYMEDDQSHMYTYTAVGGPNTDSGSNTVTELFCTVPTATNTPTYANHTSNYVNYFSAIDVQYTGQAALYADKNAFASNIATTALATGTTATTAQPGELLLGFFACNVSGLTFTAGAGWTPRETTNTSNTSSFLEEKIVSATGAYTATATSSANCSGGATIVTIKSQ